MFHHTGVNTACIFQTHQTARDTVRVFLHNSNPFFPPTDLQIWQKILFLFLQDHQQKSTTSKAIKKTLGANVQW